MILMIREYILSKLILKITYKKYNKYNKIFKYYFNNSLTVNYYSFLTILKLNN